MSVARVYRVGTPFNAAELFDIDFEQSADTMYLAHIDHVPTKLVRVAHTDWTFSSLTFAPKIAIPTGVAAAATVGNSVTTGDSYFPQAASYCVTAIDDDTGQESRASATVSATNDLTLKKNKNTISWSAVATAERYNVFKSNNTGDFGYIGSTASLSFVDDNIGPDYTDGPPKLENPFPSINNYPSTVSFYQQRLMFGRTYNRPNAVWGSRSGDYENFDTSRPLKASDGLSFALVAGRVNAVEQLVSMSVLLALTSDSVFKITGSQGVLSPTDLVTTRENGRGSSRLSPLVIDTVAFYQTSVGNTIRTLGYKFDNDGYNSNDVTIYSPHLFRGFGIVSWAYAQEPRSLIWAARSDGKLLCFTWEQEQEVWGWTLCETDGFVESVCAISEAGEDRLYLVVRRTINGIDQKYIERMAAARWSDVADCCFVDCAVTYGFTTPTSILDGLGHLEGKLLDALGDGNVMQGLLVTKGRVVLPFAVSKVTIGLPYVTTVETLPLAIQSRAGWTIAKPQQVSQATIRVVDTRGIFAGAADGSVDELRPRMNERLGDPNALMTGNLQVYAQPEINGGAKVVVTAPYPLPMTVTGILADVSISE